MQHKSLPAEAHSLIAQRAMICGINSSLLAQRSGCQAAPGACALMPGLQVGTGVGDGFFYPSQKINHHQKINISNRKSCHLPARLMRPDVRPVAAECGVFALNRVLPAQVFGGYLTSPVAPDCENVCPCCAVRWRWPPLGFETVCGTS